MAGAGGVRARLFFALMPEAAAAARLAQWREQSLPASAELRLPPAGSLHVTLAFLGGRPEADIGAIAGTGLPAAEGIATPRLVPQAVVGIPRRRPRLLALDLADRDRRVAAIAAAVAGALAAEGHHEPEERPFWPHLTLARLRGGRSGGARGLVQLAQQAPVPTAELTFDRVALMRSHPSPRGARYEVVQGRRLEPDG